MYAQCIYLQTSSSSSDSEEEGRQHKTYSKRKIVSNWDRYDIPTTEEDKVEQRGEDFTKLLHSAGNCYIITLSCLVWFTSSSNWRTSGIVTDR